MAIVSIMWGHFIRGWLSHMSIFLWGLLKILVIVILFHLFFFDVRSGDPLYLNIFIKSDSNVDWRLKLLNLNWFLLTILKFIFIDFWDILLLLVDNYRRVKYFILLELRLSLRGYWLKWWGLDQQRGGYTLAALPYRHLDSLISWNYNRYLLHMLGTSWV